MAKNKNLLSAKSNKNDEFYTQLSDIERELKHYKKYFQDKIVFCNCDDPYESNFFKYFAMNFNQLGLKKLIATCYVDSPVVGQQLSLFDINTFDIKITSPKHPYKVEITEVGDTDGDGAINLNDVEYLLKNTKNTLTLLKGDGDFRSKESIKLLKEADIVVTNPPFSLWKEYVTQLIEYNKKFIIIGSINALNYKEIFPLIQNNKMWLGYGFQGGNAYFEIPEKNKNDFVDGVYDEKTGLVKFRNCTWYTNLDIDKRHEKLLLYKHYEPSKYQKYYNYDGINIDKLDDIPCDYYGYMGVPITFMSSYNPDQFRIIGRGSDVPKTILHETHGDEIWFIKDGTPIYKVPYTVPERKAGNSLRLDDNGKPGGMPYGRIIIQLIEGQGDDQNGN